MKEVPNYIERDFAKLDELIAEMKSSKSVLHFYGPSGTGKTTTLIELYKRMLSEDQGVCSYYVNAKDNKNLGFPSDNAYIFVDEAQDLVQNDLLRQDLRGAKSYCLAFSPVLIAKNEGVSSLSSEFKYTREYHFGPYTESEVDKLIGNVPAEFVNEAKKMNVLMPRMFVQCRNSSAVARWVNKQITHLLSKVKNRLSSGSENDLLRDVLLKASLGKTLTFVEKSFAETCGFFYMDDSEDVHLIFPPHIMLPHLYESIRSIYGLMREYDKGGAFEFLVHAQLLIEKNSIYCMAAKPSALGNSEAGRSCVNAHPVIEIEQCVESINQSGYHDELKPKKNWCVVKLCDGHYGVDFLIISNTHGADSKRLFFVQTSMQKHQSQSEKKLSCVYDEKPFFGGKSVLHFYSVKLRIPKKQCFYVYACPEIPNNHTFSRDPAEQAKVYFLQVNASSQQ